MRKAFVSGGREYVWGGGYGGIIESFERGVREGDVRVIEKHLFYAYMVRGSGDLLFRKRVSWSQTTVTNETVAQLHREFFGCP